MSFAEVASPGNIHHQTPEEDSSYVASTADLAKLSSEDTKLRQGLQGLIDTPPLLDGCVRTFHLTSFSGGWSILHSGPRPTEEHNWNLMRKNLTAGLFVSRLSPLSFGFPGNGWRQRALNNNYGKDVEGFDAQPQEEFVKTRAQMCLVLDVPQEVLKDARRENEEYMKENRNVYFIPKKVFDAMGLDALPPRNVVFAFRTTLDTCCVEPPAALVDRFETAVAEGRYFEAAWLLELGVPPKRTDYPVMKAVVNTLAAKCSSAKEEVGIASSTLSSLIAKEFKTRLKDSSLQNLVNAAHVLAFIGHGLTASCSEIAEKVKTRSMSSALFSAIAEEAKTRLKDFSLQDLAQTAFVLAVAGHTSTSFWGAIVEEVQTPWEASTPDDLAERALLCAFTGHTSPALLDKIAEVAKPRLQDFTSPELSMTALAFAKAGQTSSAFFAAIAEEIKTRLKDLDLWALALTACALAIASNASTASCGATSEEEKARLSASVSAIAEEAETRLKDISVLDLAQIVFALAVAGHTSTSFWGAIVEEVQTHWEASSPNDLAKRALVCAFTGYTSPALFDKIAEVAKPCLQDFTSPELSMTAVAFAKAGQTSSAFFAAIAEEVKTRQNDLNPQCSSLSAFALASAGPEFFDPMAGEIKSGGKDLPLEVLMGTACLCDIAGHTSSALFGVVAEEVKRRLKDHDPKILADAALQFGFCRILFRFLTLWTFPLHLITSQLPFSQG